ARLVAREELADNAAGGEDDRVFVVDVFGGRGVFGDVEAGAAVGEVERAGALRDGVPRAGLEQARRARVVDGRAVRRFARAGPEDAVLALDLLVGDARVVDDGALRGHAQLFEDGARALERQAALAAQGAGDVLDDAPVLPRLARRVDGLVDLDDPPLDLRDGPF